MWKQWRWQWQKQRQQYGGGDGSRGGSGGNNIDIDIGENISSSGAVDSEGCRNVGLVAVVATADGGRQSLA